MFRDAGGAGFQFGYRRASPDKLGEVHGGGSSLAGVARGHVGADQRRRASVDCKLSTTAAVVSSLRWREFARAIGFCIACKARSAALLPSSPAFRIRSTPAWRIEARSAWVGGSYTVIPFCG